MIYNAIRWVKLFSNTARISPACKALAGTCHDLYFDYILTDLFILTELPEAVERAILHTI